MYNLELYVELATGLGSIPSSAQIISLLFETIFVSIIDNFVNGLFKGEDCMENLLLLGLGVCSNMAE